MRRLIFKSIYFKFRDLLQPINQTQLMRPQATMGSNGITLPIYNQAQSNFNPLLEYENPRALMDPFFYNNIDQKAQIEGIIKIYLKTISFYFSLI